MILRKENVVRYIVNIDAQEKFIDGFGAMCYIEEMFKRGGIESELDKIQEKGCILRLLENESHGRVYAVEYVSETYGWLDEAETV